MDNEQIEKKYQELIDRYGKDLPNPLTEPRRFEYYVKLLTWGEELSKRPVDTKQ